MKKISILLSVLFLSYYTVLAQNKITFSGYVKDLKTKEALIGTVVLDSLNNAVVYTNAQGYFNLKVSPNSTILIYDLNFKSTKIKLNDKDTFLTVFVDNSLMLDEIVIKTNKFNVNNVLTLSGEDLNNVPAIGAKADLGRILQTLPGIQPLNEGSTMLSVRGGDPGQNKYLIDEFPLIHVNHFGGIFSVFNPDMINTVDVYKGDFPSNYGGSLSSIVSINQKEGNGNSVNANLHIGLTDLSFGLEGSINKKTTFILNSRRTLTDPLMYLGTKLIFGDAFLYYGFQDHNAKLSYKLNDKNTFHFNIYYGNDFLNAGMNTKEDGYGLEETNLKVNNTWGNFLAAGTWKKLINKNLTLENKLSYTRYKVNEVIKLNNTFIFNEDTSNFNLNQFNQSSLQDVAYRLNFKNYISNNWFINFGFQSSFLLFQPSYFKINNVENTAKIFEQNFDNALYIENKWNFQQKFFIDLGIRAVAYSNNTINFYDIEPRLNLKYLINNQHKIVFNYSKMNQFTHLLFTPGNLLNNQIWFTSNDKIKPSNSEQFSLGWDSDFYNGKYSFSITSYYKKMNNLNMMKDGFLNLYAEGDWESKIETNGEGWAKGIEFLLKKNQGKFKGFVSYTFSSSTRRFENINQGLVFNYDFDRPHSLNFLLQYQINKKFFVAINWVFQSGLPFTEALGKKIVPGLRADANGDIIYEEVLIYGNRNGARMRDYHRLDLSLRYSYTTKRNRRAEWVFSIYNAYNQFNPYNYYYHDPNTRDFTNPNSNPATKIELRANSVLQILPTFSYKIYFNDITKKAIKESVNKRLNKFLFHQ